MRAITFNCNGSVGDCRLCDVYYHCEWCKLSQDEFNKLEDERAHRLLNYNSGMYGWREWHAKYPHLVMNKTKCKMW
jgi:hypothetical protein